MVLYHHSSSSFQGRKKGRALRSLFTSFYHCSRGDFEAASSKEERPFFCARNGRRDNLLARQSISGVEKLHHYA